jgi:NDP-sugar pyrophosphorylase family protein
MIYLWVSGEGWKEFEVADTAELEKRGIRICDRAIIGDGAIIGNGARIGDRARIGNVAIIGYRAIIGDGATPIIIYIIGSRFPVSYWGEDRIDIGCQKRSIEGWLTDYAGIAAEHNFTDAAIAEYRGYVEFIQSVHVKEEAAAVGGSSNSSRV